MERVAPGRSKQPCIPALAITTMAPIEPLACCFGYAAWRWARVNRAITIIRQCNRAGSMVPLSKDIRFHPATVLGSFSGLLTLLRAFYRARHKELNFLVGVWGRRSPPHTPTTGEVWRGRRPLQTSPAMNL